MILRSNFVIAVVVLALLAGLAANAKPVEESPEGDFISMFNGKDLTEWEGASGWWEVRDGILVGESTLAKPCQRSHYLYWKTEEPGDFEMRVTYRINGEANSGIQFRSEARPEWDTWGYQADLDSAGHYTGCVYQNERGLVALRGQYVRIDEMGEKTIASFGNADELLKAVRPNDWNEYRILAEGPNITLWINGVRMCQVEDYQKRFALPRGMIALQMHQGPPMKVEFKDLRIRFIK